MSGWGGSVPVTHGSWVMFQNRVFETKIVSQTSPVLAATHTFSLVHLPWLWQPWTWVL